jgi:hypothetical protein
VYDKNIADIRMVVAKLAVTAVYERRLVGVAAEWDDIVMSPRIAAITSRGSNSRTGLGGDP